MRTLSSFMKKNLPKWWSNCIYWFKKIIHNGLDLEIYCNKTVLLCDHKRPTARETTSHAGTPILSGGTLTLFKGHPPHIYRRTVLGYSLTDTWGLYMSLALRLREGGPLFSGESHRLGGGVGKRHYTCVNTTWGLNRDPQEEWSTGICMVWQPAKGFNNCPYSRFLGLHMFIASYTHFLPVFRSAVAEQLPMSFELDVVWPATNAHSLSPFRIKSMDAHWFLPVTRWVEKKYRPATGAVNTPVVLSYL